MPAFFQLEPNVQVQVLEDGVGRGQFAAEPALSGALQVVLALYVQVSLEQVVHYDEPHLHHQSEHLLIVL